MHYLSASFQLFYSSLADTTHTTINVKKQDCLLKVRGGPVLPYEILSSQTVGIPSFHPLKSLVVVVVVVCLFIV